MPTEFCRSSVRVRRLVLIELGNICVFITVAVSFGLCSTNTIFYIHLLRPLNAEQSSLKRFFASIVKQSFLTELCVYTIIIALIGPLYRPLCSVL